jgi:hypothetical protein
MSGGKSRGKFEGCQKSIAIVTLPGSPAAADTFFDSLASEEHSRGPDTR